MNQKKNRTALITGASGGLGAELAKLVAGDFTELILVARSMDRLNQVREKLLSFDPSLQIDCLSVDLTNAEDRRSIVDFARKRPLDLVLLNAGFGTFKMFVNANWADHLATIDGNVTANLDLAYHLLQTLIANGSADRKTTLQIVSSHSSGLRIPHFSVYAPAKTMLTLWAETIAMELRHEPVNISVVCPGAIATEFSSRSGIPKMVSTPMSADEAAKRIYAHAHTTGVFYITLYDRFLQFTNWICPKAILNFVVNRMQQKALMRAASLDSV